MKLASLNLKASKFTSYIDLVTFLLLADFIEQARLLNVKCNCLENCTKDFTRNDIYLVKKIKKKFKKERGGRERRREGKKEGRKKIIEFILRKRYENDVPKMEL